MDHDAYRREIARIRVTGRSANGWMSLVREADGDITVNIAAGALRRHTEREVASEIESLLTAANAEFHRSYQGIRRRHFGAGLGVIPVGGEEDPDGSH